MASFGPSASLSLEAVISESLDESSTFSYCSRRSSRKLSISRNERVSHACSCAVDISWTAAPRYCLKILSPMPSHMSLLWTPYNTAPYQSGNHKLCIAKPHLHMLALPITDNDVVLQQSNFHEIRFFLHHPLRLWTDRAAAAASVASSKRQVPIDLYLPLHLTLPLGVFTA